jgi:hypothetical protein
MHPVSLTPSHATNLSAIGRKEKGSHHLVHTYGLNSAEHPGKNKESAPALRSQGNIGHDTCMVKESAQ